MIKHEGRVLSVTSVQTKVEILAQTACAACHAKAVCGASTGESRDAMNVLRIDRI